MKLPILLLQVCLFISHVNADERSEWLMERQNWIDQARNDQDSTTIPNLSRIVRGVGSDLGRASPEAKDLFYQAQTILLAIPGHAEYFRDRINGTREKMEAALAAGNQADYPTYRHQLSDEIMYGFETLSQLPSVETVRVLGEFLFDERGYVKMPLENTTEKQRYDSIKHGPVFHKAAGGLDTLPIVAKPMKAPPQGYDSPEETTPWRQWYQEIKDGKRTFRFEGDPTEYDLNGPAPKEKLERIALASRMDKDRAARHGGSETATNPEQTDSSKTSHVGLVLAALAVLASLVWYFRKAKSR